MCVVATTFVGGEEDRLPPPPGGTGLQSPVQPPLLPPLPPFEVAYSVTSDSVVLISVISDSVELVCSTLPPTPSGFGIPKPRRSAAPSASPARKPIARRLVIFPFDQGCRLCVSWSDRRSSSEVINRRQVSIRLRTAIGILQTYRFMLSFLLFRRSAEDSRRLCLHFCSS